MPPVLRLYEDVLSNGARASYPARPRMLLVMHGSIAIDGRIFDADQAWSGEDAVAVTAGQNGAAIWRWELASDEGSGAATGAGVSSLQKLSARLETLPKGDLLLRGDSVAFPAGGCAYLHRHQGPGIRCLVEGGFRIDSAGHSTSYAPGGAWYENGREPVFAQAADRPTRFVRVMILPRAYLGKSSVEYLREEDKAKPKSQTYKIYVDMPIAFVGASS
jgi:hypothetical protein